MNKIFLMALILVFMPSISYGKIAVENNNTVLKSFEIKTLESVKFLNSKDTKLNFKLEDVSEKIDHWKLLVSCDKEVSIYFVPDNKINTCGQYVKIKDFNDDKFSLLFKNDNNNGIFKNFSFRLKAYDKNDKWLQTEKKAFKWK